MKVLVAYESAGGHTRQQALLIAAACKEAGHEVTAKPMKEITPVDVEGSDALAVGSWVEGFVLFGVRPARSARSWLADLPSLLGKRAGVFCTYAVNPATSLDAMRQVLESKGAEVVAENASSRRAPEAGASEFAKKLVGV
ncbi:MAG: flavodoxin family protein [Ferrimicrobium sp.]